jgi:hypothetical protein
MELGPELFELLNSKQLVGNQTPVKYGARGLSSEQIAFIEGQLGFRVPDDFAYLFQNLQDPGRVLFSWSEFDRRKYDEAIERVLRGIEFDIEKNQEARHAFSRTGHSTKGLCDLAETLTDLRSSVLGRSTLSRRQPRLLN